MSKFAWYENTIEPEVRELVYLLRNNGINTICSCGHEMTVQVELIPDQHLKAMHEIVFDWLTEAKGQKLLNFTIDIHHEVMNGVPMQCFAEIRILPESEVGHDEAE